MHPPKENSGKSLRSTLKKDPVIKRTVDAASHGVKGSNCALCRGKSSPRMEKKTGKVGEAKSKIQNVDREISTSRLRGFRNLLGSTKNWRAVRGRARSRKPPLGPWCRTSRSCVKGGPMRPPNAGILGVESSHNTSPRNVSLSRYLHGCKR